MNITKECIQRTLKRKGYKWEDNGVNIIGIRTNDNTPDKFNDYITISYKEEFHVFEATTEPGVYWLKNPMRVTGTFVLPPGQYINRWKIGIHHNYKALVLDGIIAGWRDNDKDNLVDPNKSKVYSDGQAVNIHHAHENTIQTVIDKYSAGCQVIRKFSDWLIFFGICEASKQQHFTYILLTADEYTQS